MVSIPYLEIFLAVIGFVFITQITNRSGLPKAWPILGMVPQFLVHVNEINDWVTKVMELSERNFFARSITFLDDADLFFTVDPANVNYIFTLDFENFPKGPKFKKIFEVLGNGIFNSDSDWWMSQRRMARRFLSHGTTLEFLWKVTREKIENALAKMLDEFCERHAVVDLQDLFDRLSFDLTCQLVMGFDLKSLCIDLPHVKFSKALDEAEEAIFYRHVFPEWSWKLQKLLGIGLERKLESAQKTLHECSAEFVRMKRESLRNNDRQQEAEQGMDMLQSYMIDMESSRKGGKDDNDDEFLRDTFLNLMIAGRDTVASALTWFFVMLSCNPSVESKIREEIDSLMYNSELDRPSLEKVIPKMVYLHGTLCESLRLYPPVPYQHKHPVEPVIFPSGHHIRPGMKVIVPLYAMGRMKSTWGEDCLEVKPERWISDRGRIRHEPSYKFLAFNTGPRTCLGKEVALRQVKMIVAFIIHNYDVQVLEGQRLIPNNSIILRIKGGLRVRIRKRSST